MNKPRSDKKLEALSEEQERVLWKLLTTPGVRYDDAREFVKKEFGIALGSNRALSAWYQERAARELIESTVRHAAVADECAGILSEKAPAMKQAAKGRLSQLLFQASVDGAQPKVLKDIAAVLGGLEYDEREAERLKLDREQIALDRDKFEFNAAKAALKAATELKQIAADASLDEDARIQAARERLFGKALATT